jgi:hypothetical protein
MEPLFSSFSDQLELVAFDAPSIAVGDFGWWHGKFALWDEPFSGWDRTTEWLNRLFESERFDGVFGASQGAALAALLVGMRAPDGRPTKTSPVALDFAIMVGGFRSDEPAHAPYYSNPESFTLPSLHMMGRADTVVPVTDSMRLAGVFARPSIIEHPGEHEIPTGPGIRDGVAEFLGQLS